NLTTTPPISPENMAFQNATVRNSQNGNPLAICTPVSSVSNQRIPNSVLSNTTVTSPENPLAHSPLYPRNLTPASMSSVPSPLPEHLSVPGAAASSSYIAMIFWEGRITRVVDVATVCRTLSNGSTIQAASQRSNLNDSDELSKQEKDCDMIFFKLFE